MKEQFFIDSYIIKFKPARSFTLILTYCLFFLPFHLFSTPAESTFLLGVDNFLANTPKELYGKKLILLANQASRTSKNLSSVEALTHSNKFLITNILVPEHGYYTCVPAGETVFNDSLDGIPLISLYGNSKTPSKELIKQADALIVDIQDIGIRSYTYLSTVYNLLVVSAELGKKVYVLDRPNPLGGLVVDGTVLDLSFKSFVGLLPIPYLHGATIGELCLMINNENWLKNQDGKNLKVDLEVVKMSGWERWQTWDDINLQWIPTSPHIPTVNAIKGAATVGTLGELGVISIGIGTTLPFQYLGSENFNTTKFAEFVDFNNAYNDFGVELTKVKYRPFYGFGNGKNLTGVLLNYTKNNNILPYSFGFEILHFLKTYYPNIFPKDKSKYNMFNKTNGTDLYYRFIIGEVSYQTVRKKILNDRKNFIEFRKPYLLY